MKINTKVRYGLKALAHIAQFSTEEKLVRIKEISEEENISVQYLEQILYKLKNEDIIEGKRGPTGGYKLKKSPKDIDLYSIYKILDDEEKVVDCNENEENKHTCKEDACGTTCIWSKLDNAMTKILAETSLEDFIKNGSKI
ncbi:MAG: Rrf2 family transcriptional regulator [Fusobacterium gastrosuis]|uniref:RrF2 family transcriptional regulator n=1 Tax=Fusobacterium TaxID=848 RepID=UPI001F4FDEAD|nr:MULTISPECIES: Rrf2 family transcriptional regulator [Fusobacterium]MDD7391778.1 Rrf2 family transcriptional regulator [Fusobacteriaceae bacterium]MCI5724754.1 Rrf2 family transcriptional regulator [Fusobacterium sp.]MCI7224013.1 Rrf2 family transcriptional regulator [Fusobacterium sp.]MDD7410743.1 Rrf2 family transcriptional regulator [Fusobacteriaceae bacterium]MDY4011961.1 Rrf2 family transcriptional regulator [Fusobacterium gastrosuis]